MIKEIFLPEKTSKRRIISKRIVGLSLTEDRLNASVIYATPSHTIIERIHEEKIPPGSEDRYNERAANVIKSFLATITYDKIHACIPSSIVTFKELTLPFISTEKINMVIDYEVEPQLPFSIQEAVVDFIITDKDISNKKSQVLVAAVRHQDLTSMFDIYAMAGIDPDVITVDLFALYGLYMHIPAYKKLAGATVLVDIGKNATSIAFLLDGHMRLIRTIAKGINTIAKHISDDTNIQIEQVIQNLENFGIKKTHDESYEKTAQKYVSTFLNDIQFTINSFSLKLNFYEEISKILFSSRSNDISGLIEFSKNFFKTDCANFSCTELLKARTFKNKTKQFVNDWTNHIIALGTAIQYQAHDTFNLRKKEFAKTHFPVMTRQMIVGCIITLAIFFTIGIRGFFQISNLQHVVHEKEKTAIRKLKKIFPPRHPALKKKKLRPLIRAAKQEISTLKEAWKPFMQENLMPLEILKDLTQTMDKRTFNINIEKIFTTLDEDGIPQADVTGLFASVPGKHFSDFGNFVKFFEQNSTLLALKEKDEEIADEGVKFNFKLKLKVESS